MNPYESPRPEPEPVLARLHDENEIPLRGFLTVGFTCLAIGFVIASIQWYLS